MGPNKDAPDLLSAFATLILGLLVPFVGLCVITYSTTFCRYQISVRRAPNYEGRGPAIRSPPLIPYAIPGLGSTISFSYQAVGKFWTWLRTQAERYHQEAFSIILAGKRTHLIFSEEGVSAAFKSRQLSRAELDRRLAVNVLGMSKQDSFKAFPDRAGEKDKTSTERLHSESLLSTAAVNVLTQKFMEVFQAESFSDRSLGEGLEVNLYEWLWGRVFHASTSALCGTELLEMYPDFDQDYRIWEDNLLALLFGKPRLFARQAYGARDACVQKLEKWLEAGYRHPVNEAEDPD